MILCFICYALDIVVIRNRIIDVPRQRIKITFKRSVALKGVLADSAFLVLAFLLKARSAKGIVKNRNDRSAIQGLADKSDVRRSRVRNSNFSMFDIHDRVNYSVTKSWLKINEEHTLVKLKLTVDTHFGSVMDYFEIFMKRMLLCRKAAQKLGCTFHLKINGQIVA